MKKLQVTLTGTAPMLMHADKLADPMNPASRAHKEVSKKRAKTEEDQLWLAESEWTHSIYHGSNGQIVIPSMNLRAALIEGAKLNRLGTTVKRGVMFQMNDNDLIFDGPQEVKKLWKDVRFRDVRAVRVGAAKIMRYRPKFDEWMVSFGVMYDPESLSLDELKLCFNNAGAYAGLGDFRPLFGRFECDFS